MAEYIQSGPGPAGERSPRTFTRPEIAAARRLGLAHGKEKHDALGGTIFWATGDWWPSAVRQALADYKLLDEAIQREWPKTDDWGRSDG